MKLNILLLLIFLLPSAASANCYDPLQSEADQGIRIHSELMVISLNCQHMGMRAGKNLYGEYRKFTARHANLFSQYETIMMEFFKDNSVANPEKMLNTLRTKYANKISEDVAAMRPDVFCARYAPRVIQAKDLDQKALRKWAATIYKNHPVSHPICEG